PIRSKRSNPGCDLRKSFDQCRRSGIACRDQIPDEACTGARPILCYQDEQRMMVWLQMRPRGINLRIRFLRLPVPQSLPAAPLMAMDDRTFPTQGTRNV